MSELSDYLEQKRSELHVGDYVDANGERLSCWKVAATIARALKAEGKTPVVYEISDTLAGRTYPLYPVMYEGRVGFAGHVVCSAEGLAYDPLLEQPELLETYSLVVFGRSLELREVPEDVWQTIR